MGENQGRKGVSFKLTQNSIDMLEEVRAEYERRFQKHNADLPIDVTLSKTKMVELLIATEHSKITTQKNTGRSIPPISLKQK